jgi:hypothetical protein
VKVRQIPQKPSQSHLKTKNNPKGAIMGILPAREAVHSQHETDDVLSARVIIQSGGIIQGNV